MSGGDFVARARHEALRYGPDPWVFVRELLQNARDAGAHAATMEAGESGGTARVVFADDGEGMTFDHARRYLFTLYASSKDRDAAAAGRFGVGFWSVLRFEPARFFIRSWPRRGCPWEVELDGGLSEAATRTPPVRRGHGTEIVLERAATVGDDLARRVRDAAWQSARFLARRDDPTRALEIRVNGVSVSTAFDLPAPSACFRRGNMRGVVALGPEARVELFAQGLRVRSASALEDLLSADGSSDLTRVRFPSLADGVAPQAILDGADFEPLLARGDVRVTPGLRRLVALGQRELRRLIETQIDAVRPRSTAERLRGPLAAVAGLAICVLAGAWIGRRGLPDANPFVAPPPAGATSAAPRAGEAPAGALEAAQAPLLAYRDLRDLYEGPRSDLAPGIVAPLALTYEPPDLSLRFAAAVLERPFERPPVPTDAGPHPAGSADGSVVEVRLAVDNGAGLLRVPVPTGYRLDPESVRLAGRSMDVRLSPAGEPLVALTSPVVGVITYRTRPGPSPAAGASDTPASFPALADVARALRGSAAPLLVAEATAWVRGRVAYSTSPHVARQHRGAESDGEDLLTATLRIGAGDCDVQNAVLVSLLQESGIRARLAIGYVAEGGVALAPPHAWVEWRDGEGEWQVADASAVSTENRRPLTVALPAAVPSLAELGGATPLAAVSLGGWAAALIAVTAGAVALAAFVLARTRRAVRVAPGQDVAALLRGALQRPEAFREIPVVYRRPLVPRLDGKLVSLAEAWRLAAERRLFRSARRSELARRCARRGALVLDGARSEARVAADALGAVDLDEWDAFLRSARQTPLLAAVGKRLRALGQPCDLRATAGIGSPALLDLPPGDDVSRVVVLDAQEPSLVAAEAMFASRPCAAVLAVVDQLADAVRWDRPERRAFLQPLAREALREAVP